MQKIRHEGFSREKNQLAKTIRSIYTFYLNYFFAGLLISLSCLWMYTVLGINAIPILCWFKAITMVVFYFFVSDRKRKEFFYYQNLGISKKLLWCATFGIDILLFILSLTIGKR